MKKLFLIITMIPNVTSCVPASGGLDASHLAVMNMAVQGHAEPMIFFFDQALARQDFSEAAKWLFRYQIRAYQDSACCQDPLVVEGVHKSVKQQMDKLKNVPMQLSQGEVAQIFLEQLNWVQEKLEQGLLPSPGWVAKYQKVVSAAMVPFEHPNIYLSKRSHVIEQLAKSALSQQNLNNVG